MDDSLGSELKKVRKGKKMTLQELSDRRGLWIRFLSQVERRLRTLTFTSLRKISEALEVNINFFFDSGGANIKKKINKKTSDSGNFSYTSLAGRMKNPDFTPAIIELSAGESQKVPYTHSGQEFVYILSGQLEVELEGVKETLYENESIHIDSSLAHHWYNDTNEVTVLLLVTSNRN